MEETESASPHGFARVAIGQTSATILGAVFWLILAVILHPFAYGRLSWLVSIATVLSTVCVFGLGKTIATYYPKEKNEELLSGSTVVVLALSLVGGAGIFLVLRPWIDPLLAGLVGLLGISLSTFSIAFHSELGKRHYGNYMWMWIGVRATSLVLPLLVYYFWGLVAGILAGLAAAYFIFGSWALKHLHLNPGLHELGSKLGFTLKALGANIGRVAINFLDKILIGVLFSMAVLGVYQFAFRIFVLLGVLPNALFFYLLPEKSAGEKTKRIETFGILVSLGLAGLIFILAPLLVPRVFPGFPEGVKSIQIMGLAVIPAAVSRIEISELYSQEKANVVVGSRLFALGVGIVGIVLSFNKSLGLIGLASSLLALQVALFAALIFFPKLLERGEKGRMTMSLMGMAVITALLLSSISVQTNRIEVHGRKVKGTGLAMGTTASITVIEENTQKAKKAIENAFDEIDRVEGLMSTEKETSEIYALNHNGTEWINLSSETLRILKKAKKYSGLTDGRFDPTAKPLVDLWMEKTKKRGKMPDPDELSEGLKLVDWRNLVIDENAGRARFRREGMKVTLGGIAKGYAIDRACKVISESGMRQALVDIGGDIRAIGDRAWTIAIQDPRKEDEILGKIKLENRAIATSGDYRRYFFLGSERIHHIINPKTGRPADKSISVTVIAENCVAADGLSTGLFVAGPEEGIKILDSLKDPGLIVNSEEEIATSDLWNYSLEQA